MSPLIDVNNLVKLYGPTAAVDNISFQIEAGEAVGLVGESGCGKSTTARLILKLIEPTRGAVSFDGQPIDALNGAALRGFRRQIQIVFQNPYATLNPRFTVRATLVEPLLLHQIAAPAESEKRAGDLLELVQLPRNYLSRFPHELSGGERQRIGIARALAVEPKCLVADEPLSSLDVTIAADILELLKNLRRRLNLTLLFISHDLLVVKALCDRILVMEKGKIVEEGPSENLFAAPRHPYTHKLLSSIIRLA